MLRPNRSEQIVIFNHRVAVTMHRNLETMTSLSELIYGRFICIGQKLPANWCGCPIRLGRISKGKSPCYSTFKNGTRIYYQRKQQNGEPNTFILASFSVPYFLSSVGCVMRAIEHAIQSGCSYNWRCAVDNCPICLSEQRSIQWNMWARKRAGERERMPTMTHSIVSHHNWIYF